MCADTGPQEHDCWKAAIRRQPRQSSQTAANITRVESRSWSMRSCMCAPMPSFVTNSTPAMASSFSVPSARDLLVTFRTVTRRFYHRWRGEWEKRWPSPFKWRELFRGSCHNPYRMRGELPRDSIRYVDTVPLTSFREHELVHPLRRSVPARDIAPGLGSLSERCAP